MVRASAQGNPHVWVGQRLDLGGRDGRLPRRDSHLPHVMSTTNYAGNFFSRRVKLSDDEQVLRSEIASSIRWVMYVSHGVLTMTTQRLIWTPFPWPMMSDIFSWPVAKTNVGSTSIKRVSPLVSLSKLYAVRVESAKGNREFITPLASDWAKQIRTWANISA